MATRKIQIQGVTVDTDGTAAANSDARVMSQKATVTLVGAQVAATATRSVFSNADVTIAASARRVVQTGTMSASRVATLPAASAVAAGTSIAIFDESGTVSPSFPVVVTRAGSDVINGQTTFPITDGTIRVFYSDGTSKWTVTPVFDFAEILKAQVFS